MKTRNLLVWLVLVSAVLSVSSCQMYKARKPFVNGNNIYFPIKQYAAGQIQTFFGTPFSLYQITHFNGVVDTTYTNFLTLDWAPIFQAFNEADITDTAYTNKYDVNMYDDDATGNRGFIYTAKDPNLLTKTLQVSQDPTNNRITSVYIETSKSDFFGSTKKKLLYVPMRVIQIIERRHSLFGRAQDLRVDYRFMRDEEDEQF